MEVDSSPSSLLQTLKIGDPCTSPKTWESIPSESGRASSGDLSKKSHNPIYESASITDSALVHLALHGFRGIKSSLVEINQLSESFCSTPADRTPLANPNLWNRSSSTSSIGNLLKSIYRTGLKVYFLNEFVSFYLFPKREADDVQISAPYSLVNQAFSVAVKKVLEGYLCALNTLSASVKLRRRLGVVKKFNSEITILEVYLHTEELRRYIESIGNICFPKSADLDLSRDDLTTETVMNFRNFPRGADLLSYLYVQLRDADCVHYELLKYLFIRSVEPYCEFIRSWIYRATINDPYEEFFLSWSDSTVASSCTLHHDLSQLVKERNDVSLPCFLRDFSRPLLRSGQQLHVLVKLLSLCNNLSSVGGGAKLEHILPCLFGGSRNNSAFRLNSLTFSRKSIESLLSKREAMYKTWLDKLQNFPFKFDVKSKWVIPIHAASGSINKNLDTMVSNGNSMDRQAATNMSVDKDETKKSDTSDDFSYEAEQVLSSDYSSPYNSEEEIEIEDSSRIKNDTSNSNASTYNTDVIGGYFYSQISFFANYKNYEDEKPCQIPISAESNNTKEECKYLRCWPLGTLNKNPFLLNSNSTDNSNSAEIEEKSALGEGFEPYILMNSCMDQSQFHNRCYNLSANPNVTRLSWITKSDRSQGFLQPFFDFSSVTYLSDAYSGRFLTVPKERSQIENPSDVYTSVKDNMVNQVERELRDEGSVTETVDVLPGVTGGAHWAGLLGYYGKDMKCTDDGDRDTWHGLEESACEMPVDTVIDKCIVQDILLQYKYVSNFTIKLLEEGYDLHEHLLALRRYHFMELADWADSLVFSLYHQKWCIMEAEQKIAQVQSLLDLALQRSACESDPYKERLFVYMKEQERVALSVSGTGLHIFDCITLGYRVDWPINIFITPGALKIYAEIFGFLGQVRFSLFSLTCTWRFLKDLMQLTRLSKNSRPDLIKKLSALIRVRQEMHHFVSTLQQYMHSQLSDVSWCRFQHSLKHQVKDILDLESLHMSYLADALHICFLSAETKPVASILRNILECAVDLSSCFTRANVEIESETPTLNLNSLIKFNEVTLIKSRFEQHLKDLYILYLKFPKHGELSLCRFWDYLNHNNYFSYMLNKEMGFIYF